MAGTGKDYSVNPHDSGPADLVPDAGSEQVLRAEAREASVSASPNPSASAPQWRQLSFRTSGLTIKLEITGTGQTRRLTGQLIPRQSAVVDIRHDRGVITVPGDPAGRFSAEQVPLGQVSLRCHLGNEQAPIVTGWITL